MTTSDKAMLKSEESFKDLLGRASPRPAPTDEEVSDVRQAVYEEWQTVTRKRRVRKHVFSLAAAATVLVAVGLLVMNVQAPQLMPVQVASIDKSVGAIFVLSEQSTLQATANLANISAGQTIQTGKESSLGLAWGTGGSLRVGADSRIHFVSDELVELEKGSLYFDSERAGVPSDVELVVKTEFGTVAHLGTQYMAKLDGQELTVSVREGRVSVDGTYHNEIAHEGEQLRLKGSAPPSITNFVSYGDDWEWVEATAPIGLWNGKPIYDFLSWTARETGLDLRFKDEFLIQEVKEDKVKGAEVDADPRTALGQRIGTFGLKYEIDHAQGYLLISDARN